MDGQELSPCHADPELTLHSLSMQNEPFYTGQSLKLTFARLSDATEITDFTTDFTNFLLTSGDFNTWPCSLQASFVTALHIAYQLWAPVDLNVYLRSVLFLCPSPSRLLSASLVLLKPPVAKDQLLCFVFHFQSIMRLILL